MERGFVLCIQQGVPEVDVKPEPSSNGSKKRHRILGFLNFHNIYYILYIYISTRVTYFTRIIISQIKS